MPIDVIQQTDPEIAHVMEDEAMRQQSHLELIASENIASPAVMATQGSISQIFPGIQGGPLMHVIAAKAVASKEALGESFRQYQKNTVVNAATLADSLNNHGLDLVSGGTDNHLMLVNLTRLGITGRDAEVALGRAGITVNKNAIPFETLSPHVTSGIRVGTPYVTSRGMMAEQMTIIGRLMADVLCNPESETLLKKTRHRVQELCDAFPLYPQADEQ